MQDGGGSDPCPGRQRVVSFLLRSSFLSMTVWLFVSCSMHFREASKGTSPSPAIVECRCFSQSQSLQGVFGISSRVLDWEEGEEVSEAFAVESLLILLYDDRYDGGQLAAVPSGMIDRLTQVLSLPVPGGKKGVFKSWRCIKISVSKCISK